MLYFITTEAQGGGSDYFIASVANEEDLHKMFNDDHTKIVHFTTDVEDALAYQYDGLALLCTL